MSKAKYRIISCSGEDQEYPASELLTPSPQCKGWQSPRFCDYPLELTLEFSGPVQVKQIQFLSHQFKIASKIEIFIHLPKGPQPANPSEIKFSKLGYLLLDTNERSEYQARELKSVYLDNPCVLMKLLFHKCHPNKYNLFNQVGIIALSVFGDYLYGGVKPNPTSKQKGGFDAIEYETQFDESTLSKIRALNVAKERAVSADDFEEAKRLKDAIERLKQIGVQLQRLEERKAIAISNEDYDSAKVIKDEIERLRSAVAPNSLLGKYGNQQPEPRFEPRYEEREEFIKPNQKQTRFISQEDQGFSQPISKPTRDDTTLSQSRMIKVQEESNDYLEQMSRNQEKRNPRALKGKQNNVDEQVIPALMNKLEGKDLPKSQLEDEGSLLEAEGLSLEATKKAELMLPFFGEQLCRKLFSKQWPLREEALKEIEGAISRASSDIDFRDAVLSAISNTIGDKISQVSIKAISVLASLSRASPKASAKGEAISFVEIIMPAVFSKVGDANIRIKEAVDEAILEMAGCNAFGTGTIVQGLLKGAKGKEFPKNIVSRISLLKEITESHDLQPNILNAIAAFAVKHLDHSNGDVRNSSISLLVALHARLGNGIRSHFGNVRPAQLEILEAEFSRSEGGAFNQPAKQKAAKVETHIKHSPQKKAPSTGNAGGNVDPSKVCDFCERYDPSFSDSTKLDVHLWKECPMLIVCNLCGQVIEISSLSSHLLDECEYRSTNRKCPRCREAIHVIEFKNHTEEMTCLPCKPAELANRCPLCHEDIPPGELGWKRHLIHEGCPNNERGY